MMIRKDVSRYMTELKEWLGQTQNEPLEDMGDFFGARVDGYEDHMRPWRDAYRRMAQLIPPDAHTLLDIGCGTGLELDEILALRPELSVTGVDLSPDMLKKLKQKHPDVTVVEADYFAHELGREAYDMAVSFETLHHFTPEKKSLLFSKLCRALKPGGRYLQADYIACCTDEETLLFSECQRRRQRDGIPPERFVHFDTPLTLENELALLRGAGFDTVRAPECIEGACFIEAVKAE